MGRAEATMQNRGLLGCRIPPAVTEIETFRARTVGGELSGWVRGDGLPVVLLHGGPGLSFGYLEGLADELGAGFRTVAFQQRELAPSMLREPFTMSQAIDDVLAVLEGLELVDPFLVGHSWGGHLALRVAAMHPGRLRAVVAVDPDRTPFFGPPVVRVGCV